MFELPPLEERPGQKDKERFRLHLSVARWESWEPFLPSALEDSPVNALREAVSRLRDAGAFADATGATYWAYHLARCGFFTAQVITESANV